MPKLFGILQVRTKVFAALLGELCHFHSAVGGIGPSVVFPLFVNVRECDFGEDTVSKVDSMIAIFGGRENQFGLRGIARIKIDRSSVCMRGD